MPMRDCRKFGGKLYRELMHHGIPSTLPQKEADIETPYLTRLFLHFYGLFDQRVFIEVVIFYQSYYD